MVTVVEYVEVETAPSPGTVMVIISSPDTMVVGMVTVVEYVDVETAPSPGTVTVIISSPDRVMVVGIV